MSLGWLICIVSVLQQSALGAKSVVRNRHTDHTIGNQEAKKNKAVVRKVVGSKGNILQDKPVSLADASLERSKEQNNWCCKFTCGTETKYMKFDTSDPSSIDCNEMWTKEDDNATTCSVTGHSWVGAHVNVSNASASTADVTGCSSAPSAVNVPTPPPTPSPPGSNAAHPRQGPSSGTDSEADQGGSSLSEALSQSWGSSNATNARNDGAGSVVYFDRHSPSCGTGTAMTYWYLARDAGHSDGRRRSGGFRLDYKCGTMSPTLGSCTSSTTSVRNDGGGTTYYLDRHSMSCSTNQLLQSWHIGRSSASNDGRRRRDTNGLYFSYTCCAASLGLSDCTTSTTSAKNDGGGTNYYFDRFSVSCDAEKALTGWRLLRSGDSNDGRRRRNGGQYISYTCCKQVTASPTNAPTNAPTPHPTNSPTPNPTNSPTPNPTNSPTKAPTNSPTSSPTNNPTSSPTNNPTNSPTTSPTPCVRKAAPASTHPLLLNFDQCDVSSSGTWADSSGHSYNAVGNSGVTVVTENGQNHYHFDGSSGFMHIDSLNFQNDRLYAFEVEVEFRTNYSSGAAATGGTYDASNWAFLDFDRSEWFNAVVRGDTCAAQMSTTSQADGTKDDLSGSTSLCNNEWHTVKYTFTTNGATSSMELFVDGTSELTVTGKHLAGVGDVGTVRYGFIGDGSEATAVNGSRNTQYYHGDIRRITLNAQVGQTPAPTNSPTNAPTQSPTTQSPTTQSPTQSPTNSPTTKSPTNSPTPNPTNSPTSSPTNRPTSSPTNSPTRSPTASPTTSPTSSPTTSPTASPTSSPTTSPTLSPTKSPTSSPTLEHGAGSCLVWVYEHWPEGITAGTVGLEAAEQAWGGRFPMGAHMLLRGTGYHRLGALSNLTSSVKVEGACCKAYGHTSADCSGPEGTPIESTTQILAGLPAGVVTPATGLSALWGCNDCAQCVKITQEMDSSCMTSAPTPNPTTAPTNAPTTATPTQAAAMAWVFDPYNTTSHRSSCDTVCQQRTGGTCNQAGFDALTDDASVIAAYTSAGFTCNSNSALSHNCEPNNCQSWGAPYLHNSHMGGASAGICFGGTPSNGNNRVATCGQSPVDGWHRRLCPCTTSTTNAPTPNPTTNSPTQANCFGQANFVNFDWGTNNTCSSQPCSHYNTADPYYAYCKKMACANTQRDAWCAAGGSGACRNECGQCSAAEQADCL